MGELVIGGASLGRPIARLGIRAIAHDGPERTSVFVTVPAPLLPNQSAGIWESHNPLLVRITGKLHVAPEEAAARRVKPGLQILIGSVAGRIAVVFLECCTAPALVFEECPADLTQIVAN